MHTGWINPKKAYVQWLKHQRALERGSVYGSTWQLLVLGHPKISQRLVNSSCRITPEESRKLEVPTKPRTWWSDLSSSKTELPPQGTQEEVFPFIQRDDEGAFAFRTFLNNSLHQFKLIIPSKPLETYRDAVAAIVTYDVNDPESYAMVPKLVADVRKRISDTVSIGMYADTSLMNPRRAVAFRDAQAFSKSQKLVAYIDAERMPLSKTPNIPMFICMENAVFSQWCGQPTIRPVPKTRK
eukprot:TRINITY_DN7123_c0_g1_i2.p1 TRINITY_DN7123_c0_g1~~TRINITY_DN7123_c0_g1_i2.p1  ORF type:complete len:240 (-),score=41.70 TRINITY_DN7123_c0_g1_i2:71-790(-)